MTSLVREIASSISDYGSRKGYRISFSYYEKLAWLGLKDSLELLLADDNDGFTEEDQIKVDDINKVIEDEYLYNRDAKGTKCTN